MAAIGTHQGNFVLTTSGTTNGEGKWLGVLDIGVRPSRPLKVDVFVSATTPGGSSVGIRETTILPAA